MNKDKNSKQICITGTTNRYQIKKLNKPSETSAKRVLTKKWSFACVDCDQMGVLLRLHDNVNDDMTKIMRHEIQTKIYGYKRQDISRKLFNEDNFLGFTDVVSALIESRLRCIYCNNVMLILYDTSREMSQWSVDRIDNSLGHIADNYHIACLKCNLARRRKSHESFLFTKQLQIIKCDG